MKILILSVNTHKSSENPAAVLKKYMESRNYTVEIIDIAKKAGDIIDKLIREGRMEKISPHGLNRLQCNSKRREKETSVFNKLLNSLLSSKLEGYIDELHPDVIISMHPFGLKILDDIIIYRKKLDIPVIAVLGGFYPDNFVLYDIVNAYVIPDESLKSTLTSKGIDEAKIYPYGMPVDTQFLNIMDRKSALEHLGLDDTATLLISGENLSSNNIINIFQSVINSRIDVQIIAYIKNNPKLEQKLNDMLQDNSKKYYISSDFDKLPQFMSASDLAISGLNWLTISEAAIKGIPVALISSSLLHEWKNIDCFLNNKAAIIIEDSKNAASSVSNLFQNPENLKKMKAAARIKAKPDAGYNIVNLVTDLYHKKV